MPPRRRLRDVALIGWRRHLRAFLVISIGASAALAFVFLALDQHRFDRSYRSDPDWSDWHSFAVETYGIPLIACALTAASAWWSRRGFPRGLVTALLALATSMGTFMMFVAVHLFDDVESNHAIDLGLLLLVPMFFAGAGLLFADWLLPLGERRRLERDEDPVFPSARVVA